MQNQSPMRHRLPLVCALVHGGSAVGVARRSQESLVHSIALEVTARCNQRCAYCYNAFRADGGKSIADPALDDLQRVLQRVFEHPEVKQVTLTGGEPLLRADLRQLVDFVLQAGRQVQIISNGGPDPGADLAWLAQKGIAAVQITLAGACAETHDAHCGSGSFARTTRAIARMREAGVRVAGSFLCTQLSSAEASDVFGLFCAAGIQRVAFNRFNPSGFARHEVGRLLPTRSQVLLALHAANSAAERLGISVFCAMPIPPCVVDRAEFPHIRMGGCSAGAEVSEPAIGVDGSVRMCTLLADPIGNVFEQDLATLPTWSGARAFRSAIPVFCQDCPKASSCLGGCGAAALWLTGSASGLDPFIAQHVENHYLGSLPRGPQIPLREGDAP